MHQILVMIPVMASEIRVRAIVLDCPDPLALSGLYAEVLGWPPDPRAQRR